MMKKHNQMKLRNKIILLAILLLPALGISQQPAGDAGSAPPIIRNKPLTPVPDAGATDPSILAPDMPPAEIPQEHDIGNIGTAEGIFKDGYIALAKWDLVAADKVAEQIKKEGKADTPEGRMFLFRLAFFHGDYSRARDIVEKLDLEQISGHDRWILDRVRNLARVMEGAIERQSEHFIVRVTPGPDEILIKDMLATLEKAYPILTNDIKIKPTGKVVVEVFPTFEAFSWATGLSDKDVETSGTVAVCKFSRLMITTPRALVYGYTWRDTVSHEFVHYLVFLRSGYSAPIWLHEGIAKYEEERWRGIEGGRLTPTHEALLASALDKNELVTFDEMEPTFAKLPSPMHGALAFAEVSMAVKYLVSRGGFDLVIRIVDRLKKNPDYKKAIREELGEPYETFHRKWIAYMKSLPLKWMENVQWVPVKMKKSDSDSEDNAEVHGTKKESQVYKYYRLGDLLREQGRFGAALIEYKKALNLSPDSAELLNKTANMYIMAGDPNNAEPLLKKAELLNPMVYPSVYKRLGIVYISRKDWQNARKSLETSAEINPFDPEVQGMLVKVYAELGEKDLEAETKEKITILLRPR